MAVNTIQPVPSYANPFIGNDAELRRLGLKFNPQWLKWFLDLIQVLQTGAGVNHNDLAGLQGGTAGEFYHLRTPVGQTGKIARSDGTDWLATTATWPNTVVAGDLLHASAANVITGLAVGPSAGQIIRSTGTLPAWSTATRLNTLTANQLLYASATNVEGQSASLAFSGTNLVLIGALGINTTPAGGVSVDISGAHVSGIGIARFKGTGDFGFIGLDTATATGSAESGIGMLIGGSITGQFGARQSDQAMYLKNRIFGTADVITIANTGRVGIGNTTAPSARLQLPPGAIAASSGPFKFTLSGAAVQTTPEAGVLETNATNGLFFVDSTPTRHLISMLSGATALTSGNIPVAGTGGFLGDGPAYAGGILTSAVTGALNGTLGATTPNTVAATTGAFSGTITSTVDGNVFIRSGASTGVQYFDIANTGGRFALGIQTSSGDGLITSGAGRTNYATALTTVGNTPVEIGVNQVLVGSFASGGLTLTGNIEPGTDDTYYLGKNDDDTPKAWKGAIFKDQTTGTYYRLQIDSAAVTLVDLTD